MSNGAKLLRELEAADAFCKTYSDIHGPCKLVKSLDPPAPDVLIQVDGNDVGLELASYREQGVHNSLHTAESKFKSAMFEQFIKKGLDQLPHCTLNLRYLEGENGYYKIPKPNVFAAFADELIGLLRQHPEPTDDSSITRLVFKPTAELGKYRSVDQRHDYIAAEAYPILSAHCKAINLYWHPSVNMGRPRSSMDSRFTHTDWAEIDETIEQKLSKINEYRGALPEKPIWLLYYAAGFPSTARLPGKNADSQLVSHVQSLVAKHPCAFDAIWWASGTLATRGPELFRIV